MDSFNKINDLSNSPLRAKFLDQIYVPETNIAVAMGRVSTGDQKKKGNSDVAQLETIDSYAKKKSLKIVQTWDVAETASKHNKRRNFHQMIEFIRQNPQVKHVIFSHQSRSNRNRESARELEMLWSLGVALHFARDDRMLTCKSDLEDLLLWDVNNILNEKYIKDHTKNVMDGTFKRIEMGLKPGKAPFGYRNYRESENATSVFKLVPGESDYVRKAYDLFANKKLSWPGLSEELKRLFPDIQGAPKAKNLGKMLQNPFYYGDFEYDGQVFRGNPEYHPPLVSFTLWKRCQEKMGQPDRPVKKVTDREHPYMQLIRCGGRILDANGVETDEVCGCHLTGEEKRKYNKQGELARVYVYYHCSNTTRRCSQRDAAYMRSQGRKLNYSEREIETLMGEIFKPLQFSEKVQKWMQESLLKHHEEQLGTEREQRASLQRRYEMLSRYIEKAYEDKLKGTIREEMWREKNSEWELERETIARRIEVLREDQRDYIQRGVLLIELTRLSGTIYETLNPDNKKRLVEFTSSNLVLRNGSLAFDYQKPFELFAKPHRRTVWWRIGDSNS